MGSGVLVHVITTDVNGPVAVTETEQKAIRYIEDNWPTATPYTVHNHVAYQVSGVHPVNIIVYQRPYF